MLGFLIKDFYTIKKQAKIMIFILIAYFIFGVINDNPSFFLVFLPIFSTLMPLTALGYDEKNQCDKLFLCMPLTRRNLVSTRYILGLILTTGSSLIGVLCALTVFRQDRTELILLIGLLWGLCLIYFSICFPIALNFGVEKSRYVMFGLIFIPTIIVALLSKKGHLNSVIEFITNKTTMKEGCAICILVGFIIYLISWFISIRFYENKEL